MLHISSDEQKARLAERLARPDKHWKYNPGDLDERALWADYQDAYQVAIERCSTEVAPWFVVPADRKWYARLAVTELVLEHLEALDPQWPKADFDVEAEQKRLSRCPEPQGFHDQARSRISVTSAAPMASREPKVAPWPPASSRPAMNASATAAGECRVSRAA